MGYGGASGRCGQNDGLPSDEYPEGLQRRVYVNLLSFEKKENG